MIYYFRTSTSPRRSFSSSIPIEGGDGSGWTIVAWAKVPGGNSGTTATQTTAIPRSVSACTVSSSPCSHDARAALRRYRYKRGRREGAKSVVIGALQASVYRNTQGLSAAGSQAAATPAQHRWTTKAACLPPSRNRTQQNPCATQCATAKYPIVQTFTSSQGGASRSLQYGLSFKSQSTLVRLSSIVHPLNCSKIRWAYEISCRVPHISYPQAPLIRPGLSSRPCPSVEF